MEKKWLLRVIFISMMINFALNIKIKYVPLSVFLNYFVLLKKIKIIFTVFFYLLKKNANPYFEKTLQYFNKITEKTCVKTEHFWGNIRDARSECDCVKRKVCFVN